MSEATTTQTPDIGRLYAERAHAEAEKAVSEALQAVRECCYGYARDLLRGADSYLEALERTAVRRYDTGEG